MPTLDAEAAANDPMLIASLDLLGRGRAKSVQVRYDEEQDPIVWVVVAEWPALGTVCGAGLTPAKAALACAESAFDGGYCAHCGKPSGVTDDWRSDMPLANVVCWYVYDPETQKFRRSCEGETTGRVAGWDPAKGQPVGRNDPCPCGSGKKWKRCHGA